MLETIKVPRQRIAQKKLSRQAVTQTYQAQSSVVMALEINRRTRTSRVAHGNLTISFRVSVGLDISYSSLHIWSSVRLVSFTTSELIPRQQSKPTEGENFITNEHSSSIIVFYKFIQNRAESGEGAIIPGWGFL